MAGFYLTEVFKLEAWTLKVQLKQEQQQSHYFLWDADRLDRVNDTCFEPEAWARDEALIGEAKGRGAAYFLRAPDDHEWVLRHSRRGGVAANVSDDHYLWQGIERCRVFREWRFLASLAEQGLPVPAPVAARVVKRGLTYRGDLITTRVSDARPLADWLSERALDATGWQAIGTTLARFHRAGVDHHDLNARNILIDPDERVTLIDFDKSEQRPVGRWREKNLTRLRRSLDKLAGEQLDFYFFEADWGALRGGYASVFAAS